MPVTIRGLPVALVSILVLAGVTGGVVSGEITNASASADGNRAVELQSGQQAESLQEGDGDGASFNISNFQGPAEVQAGERITVEVTVTNTGSAEGSANVQYRLGGETLSGQSVTLAVNESRTVSFRVRVPDLSSGTYQQGMFLKGTQTGQTSSVVVTRPAPAFSVLRFSGQSEVRIGQDVTVEASVRNTGDGDGSSTFEYRIRGQTVDSRSVSLAAGEKQTITFRGTVPNVQTGSTTHGVFVGSTDNGLTSPVTVQPREADFRLSNLNAPSRVPSEDDISATVKVRNEGGIKGTKTLEYRIGGKVVDDSRVSLEDGQSRTITFQGTVPNLRPGSYTQGIHVAGTSTQLTTNLVVEQPSFGVSNLRVPSQAGVGDEISVEANIRNDGQRTISRSVEYRIRDRRVASQTVKLDPGRSQTVTFNVKVPSLPAGTHRQGVFVAGSSAGQSSSLRVTSGSPTFAVTNLQTSETAVVGDRISASVTINNRGGSAGTAQFDYQIGDRTIDSKSVQLNSQSSRTVTFEGTVPTVRNGTYRQGVSVRGGLSSSTSLVITAPPQTRPVWAVTSIATPKTAQVGDRISVSATVENRGDSRATRRLEYRIGDQVVDSRTVTVNAGSEQTVTFDVRIPAVDGGSTTHGVFIGSGSNGRTARIDLTVGQPEFVVGDLRGPAKAGTGDSVTVRASITNVGKAGGETEVQYRLGDQVVDTQTVSLTPGQRRVVTFNVTVPDVESDTYSHGVFVDDTNRGQTSSIVVEAPTPTPTDEATETTAESGPGFSLLIGLASLLAVAIIAARRRR